MITGRIKHPKQNCRRKFSISLWEAANCITALACNFQNDLQTETASLQAYRLNFMKINLRMPEFKGALMRVKSMVRQANFSAGLPNTNFNGSCSYWGLTFVGKFITHRTRASRQTYDEVYTLVPQRIQSSWWNLINKIQILNKIN